MTMPLPLIPLLVQLAGLAPTLMKYVGAGESSVKVAEQVIGVAQAVTGASSPEAAVAALGSNPEQANAFRLKVLENERAWDEAVLKDIQSARERDTRLHEAGYRNTRANSMYHLAVFIVFVLVLAVWWDDSLNEYVKGIVTLVLGRFLGYLDQVYNFEFGTTRASKTKDETIANLTRG